jgi:ubiquinone/menaquinone biosynthesis C-methylase UbiE
MAWVIIAVIIVVLAGLLAWYMSRPMNIPREPDREGAQDAAAVRAYDRTSRWPIFALERRIMVTVLARSEPTGLLLDIGCGPGYLAAGISRRCPSLKVIGLDINEEMINIARHNWPPPQYSVEFVAGDAHQLPFTDSSIDFAVSSLSLHHWADAAQVFREIQRVLKPGGEFAIMDLRRDSARFFYLAFKIGQALIAPEAIKRTNGAVGSFWASYTPSELKIILDTAGIKEARIDTTFGWMVARGRKKESL